MTRESFDNAVTDFQLGYIKGGKEVNKSYAPYVSQSLKNGDGKPMATYNRNNRILDDIMGEIETELSSNKSGRDNIR